MIPRYRRPSISDLARREGLAGESPVGSKLPEKVRAIATDVAADAKLPDANPKTRYGVAKPGMSHVPNTALLYLGRVHDHGADKYGSHNWRQTPVTSSVYENAIQRHLMLYHDGHLLDDGPGGSGLPHLAHVMACCAILIDAREQGTLNDDRPTPGKVAEVIAALTLPLEK